MSGLTDIECGLVVHPDIDLPAFQLFNDKYWPTYNDGTFVFHKPLTLSFDEIKRRLKAKEQIKVIWKATVLGRVWKPGTIFYAAEKRRTILVEDESFIGVARFNDGAKYWICESTMPKND